MARQPLIPCAVALTLTACLSPQPYDGAFDMPVAAAVLQPEIAGPFDEPVGFVANGHGGQIVQLALKQGRFLTDDRTVSFLRTNQLPTGDDRLLTSVAVYAAADGPEVTVYAGDAAFGQLLRVPYIVGEGPTEAMAQALDPEGIALPDGVTLADLSVKSGYTTTETWTLTYESGAFRARGSRSGQQVEPIVFGQPWSSRDRRLNLTLEGSAAEGDTFDIQTDSGLTEIDVGGAPLALAMAPDMSVMAMVVQDEVQDSPRLWWFDPATASVLDEVVLPDGASPQRLSWSEDGQLVVSDSDRPAAYVVVPLAKVATEFTLPWPTLDVASLETSRGSWLYVVPRDGRSFWIVDRATGAFVDINPLVQGDQGMPFIVPIRGIEAMAHSFRSSQYTDDGLQQRLRAVAICDVTGVIVFANADTGCLVQDPQGPRTNQRPNTGFGTSTGDVDRSFELEAVSGPSLQPNAASPDRSVIVNQCAGIAPDEQWTVTYEQNLAAWRVDGALSGEQNALAHDEQRYLSDNGEISFMIRSGIQAARDGWRFTFSVNAGVGEATGDFDAQGGRENSVQVPGDPVYFFYRVGLAGAVGDVSDSLSWYQEDIRPFVLVPGGATNYVGRVNPQVPIGSPAPATVAGPEIEIRWQ